MSPPRSTRRPYCGLAPLLPVLLLAGCAHRDPTPLEESSIELPTGWSQATGAAHGLDPVTASANAAPADIAQWWQAFNDPLMTLLIQDALEHSPDLRSARAALERARQQRISARSGWWPSLGLGASARSSHAETSGTTERYAADLDASWEIDLAGGIRKGVDAATADYAATAATLQYTRVSLAAEVALAYVQVRSLQARRDFSAQDLAAQQESLALTGWRAEAGLSSTLDTEQARANAERTRASLASLDISLATATHALAVLCGKPPSALNDLLAPRKLIPRVSAAVVADIPANTLRRRPDVLAAEHRLRAEAARIDKARAARWPSLNISGTLGVAAATLGGLSASDALASSIGAGLSLPLFDAGRRRADIAAQLAVREQSLASYQNTVLGALADVEDALATVRGQRERSEALAAAAEAANNAALLARHRYDAGSIDFQSLLETENSARTATDSLAAASAEAAMAVIRLYKALGGGWQPDEDAKP